MSTRNEAAERLKRLSSMSDQEVQSLVDRGRRVLAERRLEREGKPKYVLDSRLIDGVRWTKEMKPCGNPKCKKCRERHEYHGPVYKSYVWDGEKMRAKSHGKNKPEGWDPQETTPSPERTPRVIRVENALEALQLHAAREQEMWTAAGRWAEYYVSGRVGQASAKIFEAEAIAERAEEGRATWLYYEEDKLNHIRADEEEYLHQVCKEPPHEEFTIARAMLDSPNPEETLEAALRALLKAREVVQQFEEYQKSYEALPQHYYEDPDAVSRIEKLQGALAKGRLYAMETSQEWLDVHAEALDRLESEIDSSRKEVKELEDSVSRLAKVDQDRSRQ